MGCTKPYDVVIINGYDFPIDVQVDSAKFEVDAKSQETFKDAIRDFESSGCILEFSDARGHGLHKRYLISYEHAGEFVNGKTVTFEIPSPAMIQQ